jgi:superfamily II DNA/RNA helicase
MSEAFTRLGLAEPLAAALGKLAVTTPTAIQEQTIPLILAGKNVVGQSATGTGKTFAYLLPVLQNLDPAKREVQALVLAPTYELAMQIYRQVELLQQHSGLTIQAASMIGNVNIARQIEKLKEKPQILIGSAGRILELMQKRKISAQTIRTIVLDEADRLFDDQNLTSVKAVIKSTFRDRQLLLFSATVTAKTLERAKEFVETFELVKAGGAASEKPDIRHLYVISEHRDKIEALRKLAAALKMERGLVFVNKTDDIEITTAKLNYMGLKVAGLHGGNEKLDRKKALDDFRAGRIQLLVASDIAARGLDIAGVDTVINLDMPDNAQLYLHRVGRTGRAGRSGTAVSIVAVQEKAAIEQFAKSLKLQITAKQLAHGRLFDAGLRVKSSGRAKSKPKASTAKKR